ncbi:hypothetical protein TanjilG_03839 [Lupinus angustifolius]|uniref:Uncharacterized protein n=1 Tax=Lupinus angustifolius TaxID=3871 RepID=A0A1J7H0F0_LUPAN|nr:hypothetical protein TanjilG_03839 [Lupinus angustifolius]
MEEYLHYMKTLRSQMNDVEEQAAKISVEEEMQSTNVRTLEKDIDSAKSEISQLKEDSEKMKKEKGEMCSKILEKQKKVASLESDISSLTQQTLELIQQERVGLSAKLSQKRAYYSKVAEDMSAKLQHQQEWFRNEKICREVKEQELDKEKVNGQKSEAEGMGFKLLREASIDGDLVMDNQECDARKNLITKVDSAKAKLDEILLLKAKVLMENNKMKLAIEDVKSSMVDFKPELKAADVTALEEEFNALLSDKAGEREYLQSLENQIEKLKEFRHVVKCACGEEYTVAVNM